MLSVTSTRLGCCRIVESSIGLILHAVKFACHKSVSACIIDIIMAQRQSWIHILNCSRSIWVLLAAPSRCTYSLLGRVMCMSAAHVCTDGLIDQIGCFKAAQGEALKGMPSLECVKPLHA